MKIADQVGQHILRVLKFEKLKMFQYGFRSMFVCRSWRNDYVEVRRWYTVRSSLRLSVVLGVEYFQFYVN